MPRAISAQATERAKVKLEGTVLNIDKEPMPNAEVQLKHEDSGQMFYSKSNKKGEFSHGTIPPGNYTLTVKKEGYKIYTGELQLHPNITKKFKIILAKEETLEQKLEKEAIKHFEAFL